MGTADSKAVVRELYEAFGPGALRAILALFATEAVWANHAVGSPLSGEHKGRIGVQAMLVEAAVVTDVRRMDLTHLLADGDHVVAVVNQAFTVRATGYSYEGPVMYLVEVREGLIVRVDEFLGDLDQTIWTYG